MARNAPCAKAARQRVSTECVHHRSTFASMRNTDSESDAESDADTESVVVDENADSVVWDTVKPNARLRTRSIESLEHARRCWLSTGTKVATAEEH